MKKVISGFPEFAVLFPRTSKLVAPVNSYEYSKSLLAFKGAIREDMDSFIGNISGLHTIPKYQELNKKVPGLTFLFSASTILSEVNGDNSFAGSLIDLEQKAFLNEPNNYAAVIKLLTIISNSLTNKSSFNEPGEVIQYISPMYISSVTHEDPGMLLFLSRVYLGLLWQKTSGIKFVAGNKEYAVSSFLDQWNQDDRLLKVMEFINNAVVSFSEIEGKIFAKKEEEFETQKITGKAQMNLKRIDYYSRLLNGLLNLSTLYKDPVHQDAVERLQEITGHFPEFSNAVMSMIRNFSEEQYSLGVANLTEVLDILSDYLNKIKKNDSEYEALAKSVRDALTASKKQLENEIGNINVKIKDLDLSDLNVAASNEITRQEYLLQRTKLEKEVGLLNDQIEVKDKKVFQIAMVIKYVNLLVAVTKAENSEAVEKLLETYALPVGSSRIKKVSKINVAINGYVGGFFGRDGVSGSGFTNRYGLTAPIGFTVSHGMQKAGSISAFIGVFDIGGTIRYKLDNEGKYQQDVSLAGIVAPSAHFVYGFPWYIPLSAGVGCQWVSPVSADSDKINLKPTINAFLAVDIPLFNLTRSNK